MPLILSFQEGDTRSSFDPERIGGEVTFCRLVATRTRRLGMSQALVLISCIGTASLSPDRHVLHHLHI